jgi:hypothetical protein
LSWSEEHFREHAPRRTPWCWINLLPRERTVASGHFGATSFAGTRIGTAHALQGPWIVRCLITFGSSEDSSQSTLRAEEGREAVTFLIWVAMKKNEEH